MTNPPINTPKISINSLGAIVTAFRHRSRGIRRILEFGEILRTGDANVLYRWNMHDDTFAQISEMTRLTETLELYAGLNEKSISADIQEKASILRWMAKNEVFDVNDAGFIVANYYSNKKAVNDAINEDVKFSRDIF